MALRNYTLNIGKMARHTGPKWALPGGNAFPYLIPSQTPIMAPQARRTWALGSSDDPIGRSPLFLIVFSFFSD